MLLARLPALGQQLFDVLGFFKVLVTVVAADMFGDDAVLVIQHQPGRINFEHEGFAGISRRHRVAIGVEGDPATLADQHRLQRRRLIRFDRQGLQRGLFGHEEFLGRLVGLAMHAHVGHFVQPAAGGGIDGLQAGELQAGQEVLLDIMHGFFHAPFFMRLFWDRRP